MIDNHPSLLHLSIQAKIHASEFEMEKDAERKSPNNEMSALREPASG